MRRIKYCFIFKLALVYGTFGYIKDTPLDILKQPLLTTLLVKLTEVGQNEQRKSKYSEFFFFFNYTSIKKYFLCICVDFYGIITLKINGLSLKLYLCLSIDVIQLLKHNFKNLFRYFILIINQPNSDFYSFFSYSLN